MFSFILENISTVIASGVIALLAAMALRKIRKDRKAGIHSCGGNCSACAMGSMCDLEQKMTEIRIPGHIQKVMDILSQAGHEAYVVGGCVRDSVMGNRIPSDWDVCTSASPEETKECFSTYQTIDIGMKHGTVGVVFPMEYSEKADSSHNTRDVVEITTYRIDGEYHDSRHPDKVKFTNKIQEDLARRDFTMNAMAYNPGDNLVDPYEGRQDIEKRIIRTVGNPRRRFAEDALRIMRGLRFAAQLGFVIEKRTAQAMDEMAEAVRHISAERVQTELIKLIEGEYADQVLKDYRTIIAKTVPGLQCVPVSYLPNVKSIRLAKLFPKETESCMKKLRMDRKTTAEAVALARLFAEKEPENEIAIKRCIRAEGLEIATLYMEAIGRKSEIDHIIKNGECCTVAQLDISGQDITDMGISGRQVGETLEELLDKVIEGKIKNERSSLLNEIKR